MFFTALGLGKIGMENLGNTCRGEDRTNFIPSFFDIRKFFVIFAPFFMAW
jgi:hypothetical protein